MKDISLGNNIEDFLEKELECYKRAVVQYYHYTVYRCYISNIHTIYCVIMLFCNSPFLYTFKIQKFKIVCFSQVQKKLMSQKVYFLGQYEKT